ncbi:MAG: DegV family protein [Parasporobacterium sp.]|nr:DegV family protein [Parasporobacterium sp.]
MTRIISDSTSDLSQELIEKYDITIVPLRVILGDDDRRDGVEITPDQIYEWSDANKSTPKTSATSIDDVEAVYNRFPDDEMVAFSISSEMSMTNAVLKITAQEMGIGDRVKVIDSRNLSTGIGLLVIEAAIMAQNGKSAQEIADRMEELIPKVRTSFVVDTLTYLHRGGRCSSVAAVAGSALKLHPEIAVTDGVMEAGKKFRGPMKKVLMHYVEEKRDELLQARKDRVSIVHSGCDEETIRNAYEFIKGLDYFDEILVTRAGGVISSHCGPGTLGIIYIAQ